MRFTSSLLTVFMVLLSTLTRADSPPITDIFQMNAETATGVINATNGSINYIAPGTAGNFLRSNGTVWTSTSFAPGSTSWGAITGLLSNQTDLQTALNGKEPLISSGTISQYWRGDKTFQTLNTTVVPEGTNLYFTNARAQGAVSASAPLVDTAGVFSIPFATTSVDGYLKATDFTIFNNKQSALSFISPLVNTAGSVSLANTSVIAGSYSNANITVDAQGRLTFAQNGTPGGVTSVTASSPINSSGGATPNITCDVASGSQPGCLSSTDWSTFNGKQSALTFGSISTSTSGVTVVSGANSTVGPNVTVNVQTASGSQPGLLSSTDWNTFNNKQPAGSYITSLTGDVTGSGPGAALTTIANSAVTNAKMANMSAHTYKGNNTGSTAAPIDVTSTQLTADLNQFTSSLQGLVPGSGGGTSNFLRADGTWTTPGGGGTVTSVALALPSIFSVSGSPVTSSGTLTGTLTTQSANTVFAGPTSGSAATPGFRGLVSGDIPALSYVSSVSGTPPIISSGGLTPAISISQSTTSTDGYLSSTDWNTFNNKLSPSLASAKLLIGNSSNIAQAQTASGDLTLSNSGSFTVANQDYKRYINFVTGDDSVGTGSQNRPWKTVQKACTALSGLASVNTPFTVYLSGGNNDSDSFGITCMPNINFTSDYLIQISQAFTISGGSANDTSNFTNIIFIGAFTWIRNDATAMGIQFNNAQFFSGPILKQNGSGSLAITSYNTVTVNADFKTGGVGSFFFSPNFLGTTTFEDANSSAYYQIMGGYSSSAISISGGAEAYFSGMQCDVPFGCSLTTTATGNGTPIIQADSGSIPPSISGSNTLNLISQANHENYSPTTPGDWFTGPTTVSEGLDSLAGTGIYKSQSAKLFFASPNGSSGLMSPRAIVATDIPSLNYVSNVTATAPVLSSGGLTPDISMHVADATHDGYLSQTDWSTFNSKLSAPVDLATQVTGTLPYSSVGAGVPNTLAGFDSSGNLFNIPSWSINGFNGLNFQKQVDLLGGSALLDETDIAPTSSTTGIVQDVREITSNLDPNNSGFNIGDISNGNGGLNLLHLNANYSPNVPAGVGSLTALQIDGNVGDGVTNDQVYFYRGVNINPNFSTASTLNTYMGYGSFPNFQTGTTIDGYQSFASNAQINGTATGFSSGMTNFINVGASGSVAHYHAIESGGDANTTGVISDYIAVNSYLNHATLTNMTGYNFGPTNISTGNFTAVNINPNNITATSNFTGVNFDPSNNVNVTGTLSGYGFFPSGNVTVTGDVVGMQISPNNNVAISNNFIGIQIAPNTNVTASNAQGINVDMSGISIGANQKTGVSINDGALSVNSNYDTSVQSPTPGEFQQNIIGGLFHVASGFPMSNTFGFGNNLAHSALFEDDMSVDPTGLGLGYTDVGFVGQVAVASGKTVDTYNLALGGAGVPNLSTGGTITNVDMFKAIGFLNEGGTLVATNIKGFEAISNLCTFGTNCWGVYSDAGDNFFKNDIVISGTSGQPTNTSVGLEIQGTTKALRVSNLTTTQKNALTPLVGMQVWDTTLNEMDSYDGTSWVSMTGGAGGMHTNMDNMASPTAMSQDLTWASSAGTHQLLTNNETTSGQASDILNIETGSSETANTGDINEQTGKINDPGGQTSGSFNIKTGGYSGTPGTHTSGNISQVTGNSYGSVSGDITRTTGGDDNGGNSGNITDTISTVDGVAGNYTFVGGNSTNSNPSSWTVSAGSGPLSGTGGIGGSLNLNSGYGVGPSTGGSVYITALGVDTPNNATSGGIYLSTSNYTGTLTGSYSGGSIGFTAVPGSGGGTDGQIVSTANAITFSSYNSNGSLLSFNDVHLKYESGYSLTPTATPNANAGSGATCIITGGTDVAGFIELNTGTAGFALGDQCDINFAKSYITAPHCVLQARNSKAAGAATNLYTSTTTGMLTLNFVVADITSNTYQWDYHCEETY